MIKEEGTTTSSPPPAEVRITKEELDRLLKFRNEINTLAWLHRTWKSKIPDGDDIPPFARNYEKENNDKFDEFVIYFRNLIHKYMGEEADMHGSYAIDEHTGRIKTRKEKREE